MNNILTITYIADNRSEQLETHHNPLKPFACAMIQRNTNIKSVLRDFSTQLLSCF